MKGKFWINPFLDNFYEWGVGKYWEDKLSFLKFLDETLESPREGSYSRGSSTIMPVKVKEYIKEKVPEWYWKNGFSMNIGQGVDGEENSYYDSILKAWESGEPFRK